MTYDNIKTHKESGFQHGVIILTEVTTPCFYIRKSIEIGRSLISSAPREFQ